MSDRLDKIRNQVEFYFGDSNLPRDKFLLGEISKNPEGFVSLEVIGSFNRMKTLAKDLEEIQAALVGSNLLVLSDDKTMVKRATPMPEVDGSPKRSIYAKRFPNGTTIEQVSDLFSPFGKVLCVRLRRTKEKIFKGSVFVEFSSEEEAQKAAAQKLSYGGEELTICLMEAYNQEKKEELKQKRKGKNHEDGEKKGEKKRKKEGEDENEEGEGEEKNQTLRDYTHGLVIHFEGIGNIELVPLKEMFKKYGQVQFLNKERDATTGHVRFETPEEAAKALAGFVEDKVEVGGKIPTLRLLSGDEERQYYENVWAEKKKRMERRDGNRRGGGGNKKRHQHFSKKKKSKT